MNKLGGIPVDRNNPELLVEEHYVMFKETKPILFETTQLNIVDSRIERLYKNTLFIYFNF